MRFFCSILFFITVNGNVFGQGEVSKFDSLNYFVVGGLVFDGGLEDIIAVSPLWGLEIEHPHTNLSLRFQRSYIFFLPRQSNVVNATTARNSLADYHFYYDTDLMISYLWIRHTKAEGNNRNPLLFSLGHSWSGQDGSTSNYVEKLLKISIGLPISRFYFEIASSFYYEADFELYPSARAYYRFKI